MLDDGFICLVDVMGDDTSIVQAARISYGAGTKQSSNDEALIRYLYRHGHLTPFEMVEFKFLIRMPMDAWRQMIRHRTASVNEYSTRYSEAIDAAQCTAPTDWRTQAATNKQGSAECLSAEVYGKHLTQVETNALTACREAYNELLTYNVAREQARKVLPISTYTEAYWKCDLRNIFNFLSLRMDSHAQLEIRSYANAMYDIVKQVCPMAVGAFDVYDARRDGLLLTGAEVDIIAAISGYPSPGGYITFTPEKAMESIAGWPPPPAKCRERDECIVKLKRLGLIREDDDNSRDEQT